MMRRRTHDRIVRAVGEQHARDLAACDQRVRQQEAEIRMNDKALQEIRDAIVSAGHDWPPDETVVDVAVRLIASTPGRRPRPKRAKDLGFDSQPAMRRKKRE